MSDEKETENMEITCIDDEDSHQNSNGSRTPTLYEYSKLPEDNMAGLENREASVKQHVQPLKKYFSAKCDFVDDIEEDVNELERLYPSSMYGTSSKQNKDTEPNFNINSAFTNLGKSTVKYTKIKKKHNSNLKQRLPLKKQLDLYRKKNRSLRDKNSRLIEKNKNLKKDILSVDAFLDYHNCNNSVARTMVKLQLHKGTTPYSDLEKDVAKKFYYHSASCYSRMRKSGLNLPAESSVRSWIAEYSVEPGFSSIVFTKLAEKLKNFPAEERVCCLKWDEMAIKSFEEYSEKYDLIEGLEDLGPLGRKNARATKAFLFCVDSINAKNPWRQMLAFFFSKNGISGDDIKKLVLMALNKLRDIKADVRALTCDMGTANQKAYSLLGITQDAPYFSYKEKKYFALYDIPHLMKRLVYQMRTYDSIYNDESKIIVSFKDLRNTWQIDRSLNTSSILSHLDLSHFAPNSFQAMKVKRAFQLLSHTLASAIRTAGFSGQLSSSTWKSSSDFLEIMNSVIDACNTYKLISRNCRKRPISENNPQISQTLKHFILFSKSWKIKSKNNVFCRPPCFQGLTLTVSGILNLYKEIKLQNSDFEFATGLVNQDSVEHCHSLLRGRGGFNMNPTARSYRLSFSHILSASYLVTSERGNTTMTDQLQFCDFTKVSVSDNKKEVRTEKNPINVENGNEIVPYYECFAPNDYFDLTDMSEEELGELSTGFNILASSGTVSWEINRYEKNTITYFSGYVARWIINHTNCENCRETFMKTPMDSSNNNEMFIRFQEYTHNDEYEPEVVWLTRPTDNFAYLIGAQLEAFDEVHELFWSCRGVRAKIVEKIVLKVGKTTSEYFNKNNTCYNHRMKALEFLIKVKMFAKSRQHNQDFTNSVRKTGNTCIQLNNLKGT